MHQENITRIVSGLRNPELSELINIPVFEEMINDYYRVTGIGAGIMDTKGRVIVSTKKEEVRANFGQTSPVLCKFCQEGNNYFSNAARVKTLESHRCINNMWDTLTPIMVSGKHLGNIFLEQFFYSDEELNVEQFKSQACCKGEHQDAHLMALLRLPRYSKKTVVSATRFYAKVAQMISQANIKEHSKEEAPKATVTEAPHAISLDRSKTSLWDWQLSGEGLEKDEGNFKLKEVNGEWLWVSICGKMIEIDSDGKPLHPSGTITNIFKRRR